MDFRLSDEQRELRASALAFLSEQSGPEHIRAAMATPLGYDSELWRQIATELGWTSVHIPESYGGLGLGHVDVAVLFEATGESLLCAPLFSTVALAANAILEIGLETQRKERLFGIAEGRTTATLALTETTGSWQPEAIESVATPSGSDFVLKGRKSWVLDGHSSDFVIVVARAPGTRDREGLSVFMVESTAAGMTRRPLTTMDQTRRLAEIELSDVRVGSDAVLGELGGAWPGLQRTLDLAAIALAAEQVGGAQRCLDMAVDYAKERNQFNRPIGSFQAIKHKIADMYVAVESARSALYYAACIADDPSATARDEDREDTGRAASDDLSTNASLAKAWCSEVYFQCAAESIQIHGGVGFTWEYDPHLHFKRARASENWLGDPSQHRERIAAAIGL